MGRCSQERKSISKAGKVEDKAVAARDDEERERGGSKRRFSDEELNKMCCAVWRTAGEGRGDWENG